MAKKREWIRRRLEKVARKVKWPLQKRKPETEIPLSPPSQPTIDTPRASSRIANTSISAPSQSPIETPRASSRIVNPSISAPSQSPIKTPRASSRIFNTSISAPSRSPIYTSGAWQDSIETPTTPESISARIRRDVERYEQSLKAARTLSAPPVLQSSGSSVSLASTVIPPSVASTSFRPMVVSVERGKSLRAFTSAYGPNAAPKVLPVNMIPLSRSHYY